MTLLVSYPRSGNTWIRYIVETISGRPTIGDNNAIDVPIHCKVPSITITDKRPILFKRHQFRRGEEGPLIVIVRDYKEAIIRHGGKEIFRNGDVCNHKQLLGSIQLYVGVLRRYDEWQEPKMLIYYEDLISKPNREITKLSKFLGLDADKTIAFLTQCDQHKKTSVEYYDSFAGSQTKGEAIKHHAKSVSQKSLATLTNMMKKHPVLYKKYLRRYG